MAQRKQTRPSPPEQRPAPPEPESSTVPASPPTPTARAPRPEPPPLPAIEFVKAVLTRYIGGLSGPDLALFDSGAIGDALDTAELERLELEDLHDWVSPTVSGPTGFRCRRLRELLERRIARAS